MRGETAREGLTFGPYVTLLPGKYQVTYRLKHQGDTSPGTVATDRRLFKLGGWRAGQPGYPEPPISPHSGTLEAASKASTRNLFWTWRRNNATMTLSFASFTRVWATFAVDTIQVTPIKVAIPVLNYPGRSVACRLR